MEKSFLKTNLIEQDSILDEETGELTSYNVIKHKYLANTKEEFLLLYTSVLGIFERLEQSEIRVYAYLLKNAGNVEFDISRKIRLRIAEVTNLNERTVYKTCKTLLEKHLIIETNGIYKINPRYAFRGSTHERNRALKLVLEVECPNC